jgi:hypothetical protein
MLAMDQNEELRAYGKNAELPVTAQPMEVEVLAYSIEDALQNAAQELHASIINLDYEILERGKSGILGFGRKPHRVLVRVAHHEAQSVRRTEEEVMGSGFFSREPDYIANQDGKFRVVVRQQGIMLKVDPPAGNGKAVGRDEVLSHLSSREITKINQDTVINEIGSPTGRWVKIGEYTPSPFDSKVQIQLSPDEMKAFITITKPERYGRIPEIPEIISVLKAKNVLYGIKEKMISDAIDNELFNMAIGVAEGDAPLEGKDAEIKYHFKTDLNAVGMTDIQDGSVDFHKLDIIQSVVVGQVLATKLPAQRGKAGRTVSGRIIPARDGRDIKLMNGSNTHLSPDQSQVISDINGQVVFKNGKVHVEPILEVTGDVDLSTGDINFPGNVVIYGNVNDTFKVYSGANVEVKGHVGKADVVAEGNIVCRQGIQGKDNAKIVCGGDLIARFIERANVKVEGYIYVTEAIMHSNVDCKNKVICQGGKKSQIVGGIVRALFEVNAKNIGAEAYTETIIEAGTDPAKEDRLTDIHERKDAIQKEMPELQKQLMNLTMLASTGPLPPNKQEEFNVLTDKVGEFKSELSQMEEEALSIQTYLDSLGKDAKVSASKVVYPGVRIKIKNAILVVKNEFKYVTFYRENAGNIKPIPYEKSKEIEEKSKELTRPKRPQR